MKKKYLVSKNLFTLTKASLLITACAFSATLIVQILKADDNPFCHSGYICTPGQACPAPQDAPDCSKYTTATTCNNAPAPQTYNCNTGQASMCKETEDSTKKCTQDNTGGDCGLNDVVYCQWDSDMNKCVLVGECCGGPCGFTCSN